MIAAGQRLLSHGWRPAQWRNSHATQRRPTAVRAGMALSFSNADELKSWLVRVQLRRAQRDTPTPTHTHTCAHPPPAPCNARGQGMYLYSSHKIPWLAPLFHRCRVNMAFQFKRMAQARPSPSQACARRYGRGVGARFYSKMHSLVPPAFCKHDKQRCSTWQGAPAMHAGTHAFLPCGPRIPIRWSRGRASSSSQAAPPPAPSPCSTCSSPMPAARCAPSEYACRPAAASS